MYMIVIVSVFSVLFLMSFYWAIDCLIKDRKTVYKVISILLSMVFYTVHSIYLSFY